MARYNPKFQIKLNKVFNKAFQGRSAKEKDQLRATLADPVFRNAFGKMVIDEIITRTEGGFDRYGEKFAAYSKSYRNSDIFKIYGKSSKVNLTLTGEMLSSLKSGGEGETITVELIGDENKAKAHGHKYGIRTKSGKRVKRDFLGLPDEELAAIMEQAFILARNEAFNAAVELFEGTTLGEVFGQVGRQPEFDVNVLTPEVLALLAKEFGLE
jgi:hypothetical protein